MSLADEFDPSTLATLKRCPVCDLDADSSEQIAEDFIELFGPRLSFTARSLLSLWFDLQPHPQP